MKKMFGHLFFLLLITLSCGAVADVSGDWKFVIATEMGTTIADVNIIQDGNVLTGTLTTELGAVPLNGRAEENKFVFRIQFIAQEQEVFIDYSGEVSGDNVKGSLNFADLWDVPFKGERTLKE